MITWIPLALAGLLVTAGILRLAYLRWKRERIARRRVVESPNSHYAAKAVRNLEARERWESMDLDRLHEINRAEVEGLVERARVLGVDSLRKDERDFLERMEEIARG